MNSHLLDQIYQLKTLTTTLKIFNQNEEVQLSHLSFFRVLQQDRMAMDIFPKAWPFSQMYYLAIFILKCVHCFYRKNLQILDLLW